MDPQDTAGKWIQIYGGDLVPVILLKGPTLGLIEGGKDGEDSRPMYVARAVSSNGCYPGEYGSHISGARIPRDGAVRIEPRFEVLVGNPAYYEWRSVEGPFDISKINNMQPVLGGHRYHDGIIKILYIARATTEDGEIHFGNVSTESCASICYQELVQEIETFEVLVHANSNVHGVKVLTGSCLINRDCGSTGETSRYSIAVNFAQPLVNVPRVAVALNKIDMGLTDPRSIRVESFASSVRRDGFTCNAVSWRHGRLYCATIDWISIVDEPTWQKGLFKSSSYMIKKWGLEERVIFDEPFSDGPPILFACLSGIEMVGKWSVRIYTTDVGHTGFTLGIVNSGEEGGSSENLISAAVTWIAIPVSEFMKKKNVWIGALTPDMGRAFDLDKHSRGGWRGHVKFGFEFRRTPKIFVGFRQFCGANEKNLRLVTSTSNVTTSGMDWELWKWDDTKLLSAGVNFLAIDADP